jgi:pyruvate/2-oxoglutarate/acetoin dehydrogenase E1 component/TPP-dependent pyruvate/acetoin dehydrogenase alpha subunit
MIQRDFSTLIPDLENVTEFSEFKKQVIYDYWLAVVSRQCSITGRKEVLTGKAKFGIVGDGKEIPQIAMAKAFRKGDWRSGYYRDQTLLMALGISKVEDFFSQLYADVNNDPFSAGRQMNSHYATPMIDRNGEWIDLTNQINTSSDISCTAGQMGRALGLALASKLYKNPIFDFNNFSKNGDEVSFCTIGDASTAEGAFWETMNAAAIIKVPLVVAVWDDGYGISVPVELQTVKSSISKALEGFLIDENGDGIYIFKAKAWDYQELCMVFDEATRVTRKTHIPSLVHVVEVTQPQGHSTSGSHERYKSKERLDWERDYDCILKMKEWIIINSIANEEDLTKIEEDAKTYVRECKNNAWAKYTEPINTENKILRDIFTKVLSEKHSDAIAKLYDEFVKAINPQFSELVHIARNLDIALRIEGRENNQLKEFITSRYKDGKDRYNSNLYSETKYSAITIPEVKPSFTQNSEELSGYQILNRFFDIAFTKYPNMVAFGEDVGKIGDVNQGFAGMQAKYGTDKIFDCGIREWTIASQAIGLAMRGFKPIAEIQYLDYVTYALSPLSDDLATLRYRSNGIQKAPAIIRTRGHRLEGIWHAGSPMGMLLNSLKGMYLCVPRNMTQAAGMYNTLLQSDDAAIVVECLNGYRLKEKLPDNIGEFTVPLGRPEILKNGSDITLVTYGSCVREAGKACGLLAQLNISVELIDVQTLMPFDLEGIILDSLKKTNRLLIVDEDVPGGASAYILNKILVENKGYRYLDTSPKCITAAEHRTPFGSDGDYFTKPYAEDIVATAIDMMKE